MTPKPAGRGKGGRKSDASKHNTAPALRRGPCCVAWPQAVANAKRNLYTGEKQEREPDPMQMTDMCALSVYQTIASLDERHAVDLVQHRCSKKIYVKKQLTSYSRPVYEYIRDNPVPNMPRIYELAEEDGVLTVIEEYISGDTLQYRLDNHGPMAEPEVVGLALQLCRILHRLHHASPPIVHRDIKPGNIILSPDGVVKLLDINAARQYSPAGGQDTRMMGTVGYAAPEQYGFMQSSVQSDIYAVGALMNMLRTGQLPSQQAAAGRLGNIIHKCVEMSPKDRYASIDELTAALEKLDRCAAPTGPEWGRYFWQEFLPPGFRSLQMPQMGFALMGYALLFWVTLSLEVKDASSAANQINRIGATAAAALVVLFSGNYLGVQNCMPLTKNKNGLVRFIGILLYDCLIFLAMIVVLGLIGV